jgi:serine/threonine-protein kinase
MRPALDHLGRYEVLGELGRGGMARVLLAAAEDEAGTRRLYAIKQPHPTRGGHYARALLREGSLSIRHVNTVPIELICGSSDAPYGVMPYVEGVTFNKLLAGTRRDGVRLPATVLARIALDILAGLAALHEQRGVDGRPLGVVHRDIKPQNLLVGTDGVTRLIDFGLACPAETTLSRAHHLRGTLAYMAPEQMRGLDVDARADVFALGVVLWEALAGRRLFAPADGGPAAQRVQDIPALDVTEPRAAALSRVCMTALERDPCRRYASARAMADAVRVVMEGALATPLQVAECVLLFASTALAATRALANGRPGLGDGDPTAPMCTSWGLEEIGSQVATHTHA